MRRIWQSLRMGVLMGWLVDTWNAHKEHIRKLCAFYLDSSPSRCISCFAKTLACKYPLMQAFRTTLHHALLELLSRLMLKSLR